MAQSLTVISHVRRITKAAFTPGNMLPATKLLPVCCPSVAVYKGIRVARYCCRQHVAWCKRGLTAQMMMTGDISGWNQQHIGCGERDKVDV